jgi:hypothetical protein
VGSPIKRLLSTAQYNLFTGCNTRVIVPLLSAKIARERNIDFVEKANPVLDSVLIDVKRLYVGKHYILEYGKVSGIRGSICETKSRVIVVIPRLKNNRR